MTRTDKKTAIMKVYDCISFDGKNRHNISKETSLSWEAVDNALNILKALNICYEIDEVFYLLFHKPKDLYLQIKAMNEIIERKQQYINQLELRLAQIKFQKEV